MGMMDCKAVPEVARRDLGGDLVLALLARDADGLAVNIRSRDPHVGDAEARRRWNEGRARGRRDEVVAQGGAWAELDQLSARSSNGASDL